MPAAPARPSPPKPPQNSAAPAGADKGVRTLTLGYVAFEPQRPQILDLPEGIAPRSAALSQETQLLVDKAIRDIVMSGFARASDILLANRDLVAQGARALLEKETLDEAAICALAKNLKRLDA